eukprot:jgi/Botrbrau1/20487/Bobra.145_2s0047.1
MRSLFKEDGDPECRIWPKKSIVVPPEIVECSAGRDELQHFCPSNTSRREGGLLFRESIEQWAPSRTKKRSQFRKVLFGGHAWCNVLGEDHLAVEFFLELIRRTQVPEVAILGVDKLQEVESVRCSLKPAGLWRAPGVPVVAIQSLDHWQEGEMPGSYQAEFRGLGDLEDRVSRSKGGLRDKVKKSHNYRGCMTLHDGETKVTFWFVVASKSILGTTLDKKLNVAKGVKAKKVILLENREHMEDVLTWLVELFKEWMDPEVMEAFVERDQALRAMGFPHNPRWGDGSTHPDPDPLVVTDTGQILPMKGRQGWHPEPRTVHNNFLGGLNPQFFAVVEGLEKTPQNWTHPTRRFVFCQPFMRRKKKKPTGVSTPDVACGSSRNVTQSHDPSFRDNVQTKSRTSDLRIIPIALLALLLCGVIVYFVLFVG